MPDITITIRDLPGGRGAVVMSDSARPAIGRALSPAESLALDLLRTCQAQAREVRYGAEQVPLRALADALLDPEALGHAATPEIRDRARLAKGGQAVEFRPLLGSQA